MSAGGKPGASASSRRGRSLSDRKCPSDHGAVSSSNGGTSCYPVDSEYGEDVGSSASRGPATRSVRPLTRRGSPRSQRRRGRDIPARRPSLRSRRTIRIDPPARRRLGHHLDSDRTWFRERPRTAVFTLDVRRRRDGDDPIAAQVLPAGPRVPSAAMPPGSSGAAVGLTATHTMRTS